MKVSAVWDSKLFRAGIWILLVFLIILVGNQILFVFQPIVVIFETLFFSILISGVLYYVTFPFVDWLHHHKVPRSVAIFLLYLVAIGLIVLLSITIGPILQGEVTKLANNTPVMIKEVQRLLLSLEDIGILPSMWERESLDIKNIAEQLADAIGTAFTQVTTSIVTFFEFIANLFMTLVIVPFLLFYMLKEKGGHLITDILNRFVPKRYVTTISSALSEMNKLMSSYVQGLGIVCFCVGVLAYIGFLIIGLDYSLLLALFVMVTNVIPFLGPFIGAVPGVIVGVLDSPLMMLKVIIVIVIVQQMESLLISPQVIGRKLALSPLTIILVVLVAGRLGGLLGIILAIPTFTILKIMVNHVYEYMQFNKNNPQTPST
jgi:predicted PurR-regulated permease PerM